MENTPHVTFNVDLIVLFTLYLEYKL